MTSTDPGDGSEPGPLRESHRDSLRDLLLRPATEADAPAVAEVHLRARAAAVPAMPPTIHPDEETRAWAAGRVAAGDVWVAESGGRVVAMMELTATWLDQLYVDPDHAGQGVGSALLDLAKSLRPDGFALWVFESNAPARAFYRRHGLVELDHTDGSGNEEQAPDLRMAWPGEQPLRFLRAQIDEVDGDLAQLLGRRAALTAAVQPYKAVPGHAGRDPEREAEIAARMAAHAPGLGEAGFARIMHEVIGASLDAVERDR